jgi:hypothetical protein
MVVALVGALAVVPGLAHGCSCVPMDAGQRLSAGTPAVIGVVIDKQGAGSVGDPPIDQFYSYTVRVERAFNADLGHELTIRGNTNGAACGFSWSVGQRIGAFLYRNGDRWETNSCSLAAPAALEAGAKEPTVPTEPARRPAASRGATTHRACAHAGVPMP